jgi:hypothetical protein
MFKGLKSTVRSFAYSPLQILNEQFAYGHREIYLRFLELDSDSFFLAEIQHGWSDRANLLAQSQSSLRARNKFGRRYPLLVWSDSLAEQFKQLGQSNVYPVQSPWSLITKAYEQKLKSGEMLPVEEEPKSILYFPTHSYPGMSANVENIHFMNLMKERDDNSITTCLYWLDFINPRVREFYEKFSKVTCLGFRSASASELPWHDSGGRVNFLYRLNALLRRHSVIVCDELSTAAAAAISIGKNTFIFEDETRFYGDIDSIKFVVDRLDNRVILDRFGIQRSSSGLGYRVSENVPLLELVREGFGFNLDENETSLLLQKIQFRMNKLNPSFIDRQPLWRHCEW